MIYPVTTLAAAILGLWLLTLSVRVIRGRQSAKVSMGDGGDRSLGRRIRAQANLSEYAPTGLILMFLAEAQGAPVWLVGIFAAIFVVGRLGHGYAMGFTDKWALGRVGGTMATLTGLGLLALLNAGQLLLALT